MLCVMIVSTDRSIRVRDRMAYGSRGLNRAVYRPPPITASGRIRPFRSHSTFELCKTVKFLLTAPLLFCTQATPFSAKSASHLPTSAQLRPWLLERCLLLIAVALLCRRPFGCSKREALPYIVVHTSFDRLDEGREPLIEALCRGIGITRLHPTHVRDEALDPLCSCLRRVFGFCQGSRDSSWLATSLSQTALMRFASSALTGRLRSVIRVSKAREGFSHSSRPFLVTR